MDNKPKTMKVQSRPSTERFLPLAVEGEELKPGRRVIFTDKEGKAHAATLSCVHRNNVHLTINSDKKKEIFAKVTYSETPAPHTFCLDYEVEPVKAKTPKR